MTRLVDYSEYRVKGFRSGLMVVSTLVIARTQQDAISACELEYEHLNLVWSGKKTTRQHRVAV